MVTPYITFNGKCKEAMSFYQYVFKTEIKSSIPYGEYIPEDIESPPDNLCDWIMHAEMEICGTNFWFADETQTVSCGDMVKLTATVLTARIGQEYFDILKRDGKVKLPPTETYYSNFHTAVVDKYGVCWNIVSKEAPAQ
jgi:PhnB protein